MSVKGGILQQKFGNLRYFSTKRQYPPLFCYELPGTFLFLYAYALIVEKFWTKLDPGTVIVGHFFS